ncbi:MAG: selenium cofactor biosynthesis protein YqeC [Anaerolineae bacterium]
MVSLVGAGGKTSLALWLLEEAHALGWPAVYVTTTHMLEPALRPGEALVLAEEEGWRVRLGQALATGLMTFLAAARTEEVDEGLRAPPLEGRFHSHKVRGLPPEEVDALARAWPGALFLVEADGARHRWLKAPAAHEPQVPRNTTHFLPVAAAHAVGRPLDAGTVHRPEEAAALLGMEVGTRLTPRAVAALLAHPQGGLKGAPQGAEVVPVLTLWGEPWPLEAAREVARTLRRVPRVGRVVLVALGPVRQVVEVWG